MTPTNSVQVLCAGRSGVTSQSNPPCLPTFHIPNRPENSRDFCHFSRKEPPLAEPAATSPPRSRSSHACPTSRTASYSHRRRLALLTTVTDDIAIAAPAIMGLSSRPNTG